MSGHHQNRKDQIVSAALEIISEEGARNLTMKKIADKIGKFRINFLYHMVS